MLVDAYVYVFVGGALGRCGVVCRWSNGEVWRPTGNKVYGTDLQSTHVVNAYRTKRSSTQRPGSSPGCERGGEFAEIREPDAGSGELSDD